jgi:hypothetical protein
MMQKEMSTPILGLVPETVHMVLVLVCFMLLQQTTWCSIPFFKVRFIYLTVLEAENSRLDDLICLAPGESSPGSATT